MTPKEKTNDLYAEFFHNRPEGIIRAPGRVNLIGEHTDYNDGFVLPCAINFETVVAFGKREDNLIQVVASDYDNQRDTINLNEEIKPHPGYQWVNYVRGVVKHLQSFGRPLNGLSLVISGNVPQGAGLSSSASLEVALGAAFNEAYQLGLSLEELALNGQKAENQFVGCQCGIMDQMISAKGKKDHSMLLDCRTLETRLVKMPSDLAILIVHSNVKRGLVESEYNARREQCEKAAEYFKVKALRDVDLESLIREEKKKGLESVSFKRARHVITENRRTLEGAEALSKNDLKKMGELMASSHQSMRDDFEITVPAIDHLVEILQEAIGEEGGARMTGGGFGGCVVSVMKVDRVHEVQKVVEREYPLKTGLRPTFYICQASEGVGTY